MQLALQPSPRPGAIDRHYANSSLALLFWLFTYGLFTYRANLRYGDAYELMSTVRLISTAVGAGIYWLVLSKLIDGTRDRPGKPLAVIATILPASIVVLAARALLDQLGVYNPNGLPGDLRFVMVWGGYFGLWVSASFALRIIPRLNFRGRPAVQGGPPAAEWQCARPRRNAGTAGPGSCNPAGFRAQGPARKLCNTNALRNGG